MSEEEIREIVAKETRYLLERVEMLERQALERARNEAARCNTQNEAGHPPYRWPF